MDCCRIDFDFRKHAAKDKGFEYIPEQPSRATNLIINYSSGPRTTAKADNNYTRNYAKNAQNFHFQNGKLTFPNALNFFNSE